MFYKIEIIEINKYFEFQTCIVYINHFNVDKLILIRIKNNIK